MRYITEYAGNPRAEDDDPEILFKLNEHLKHVNADLTRYVTMEHQMGDYIRQYQNLPQILSSFMAIPQSLEKHMTFIDTLDEQLQTINYRFPDVLELALDTIEQVDEDAVGEVRVKLPDELTKGYNLLKRKI